MKTQENELCLLYAELQKFCATHEYEKVISASNKVLQKYPKEVKAFHCKIVGLIHTDKYEECLEEMAKNPDLSRNFSFEKAYCEYRLTRIEEAMATLESCDKSDLRTQELLAQVLYRSEKFEEAYAKYRYVMKESQDDYGDERMANLAAAVAALQIWGKKHMEMPRSPIETYEVKFNTACYQIGMGMFPDAIKLLDEAEALCRASLEDDSEVTEEEINSELAPIRIQKAYAVHMMGKENEANDIYQNVIKQKPTDPAVVAVAANNVVCINRDQSVFDSRKRIKAATAESLRHKLFAGQRRQIAVNQGLFFLHSNQLEPCRVTVTQILNTDPDHEQATLLHAALLEKEKQPSRAVQVLEAYLGSHPDSVPARLTLAQLLFNQGALGQTCSQLSSLPDHVVHRPGVVAARVLIEDVDGAADVLSRAIKWHKEHSSSEASLPRLLTAAANFHLNHGRPAEAASYLEELSKLHPGDQRCLARLVYAYSLFDKTKAERASKTLKQDETMGSAVNVDALESTLLFGTKYIKRFPKPEHVSPKQQSTKDGAGAPLGQLQPQQKPAKKKKCKVHPPKHCEPGVTLDPERWLPKRERSYYRGGRKKDKRSIMRGPQGQTTGAGDLDVGARSGGAASAAAGSGGAGGANSTPSSPRSELSGRTQPQHGTTPNKPCGASGGGAGGRHPKPKRKGNRW